MSLVSHIELPKALHFNEVPLLWLTRFSSQIIQVAEVLARKGYFSTVDWPQKMPLPMRKALFARVAAALTVIMTL